MLTVAATELQRRLSHWRERARYEPVVVTRHGRESLVLLAAEEYRRLKRLDREPLYPWELGEADLAALREAHAPDEAETDRLAGLVGAGEGDGGITGADHDRVLYGERDG